MRLTQTAMTWKDGSPITFSPRETAIMNNLQRVANSLGSEINITTLTTIMAKISEQKFYEITPSEYVPVQVGGPGAWSSNLVTYRSYDIADDFSTGVMNTGTQSARTAMVDAGVDALTIQVYNWHKALQWTIFDLELAAKSGNWDLITSKEKTRLRNYQLGIQKVAFLGLQGQNSASGNCVGLLNQPGITNNTTVITAPISSLTTSALKTFQQVVLEAYRSNNNRTAWPTHFVIPESDFNGLASQASPDFPIKSTLELLEDAFKVTTRNPNFKILPLAYGDAAYHTDVPSIAGKQVYALYNYDDESMRMNVPVPYTNTLANSLDNFSFNSQAYSTFSGVLAIRPLEMLYFSY